MRDARLVLRLVAILSLGLLSTVTQAAKVRTWITTDANGVYQLQERAEDASGPPSDGSGGPAVPGGTRDATLLWHRTYTDAMYTTAAILADVSSVAAGTSLNDPKEVEYIPLEGDGTPTWVYPSSSDFYVSASRDGQTIAGYVWSVNATSATLYKWHAGAQTPDWSFTFPCANPADYRTVAVSADGSTIAAIGRTSAYRTFIIYFSANSGIPLGMYWSTSSSCYPRFIGLSAHGEYMALCDGSDVIVVNKAGGTERWHGTGGGSDALAMSEDGNYLAYGWTTLRMCQWNGSVYQTLWTASGGTYYLNRCAFSADGSTFAAGWYHNNYDQNKIQLWDVPSSTPAWTYLYTQSLGSYNDLPSDIALTQDGSYVAVASWGNEHNVNPELEVFAHDNGSAPAYTLDTPGSMWETDIVGSAGAAYVITCGKHVHANNFGDGGDLYAVRLGNPASVDEAGISGGPRIEIAPQPMVAGGKIRLLGASAAGTLAILDAQGSLVRTLPLDGRDGGSAAAYWDGFDARGQAVPAGVYFCRATGGSARASAKLVVTR